MTPRPARRLAVFDLDGTLIAGDTNELWLEHLSEAGAVDLSGMRGKIAELGARYAAGTLDIEEFIALHLVHLRGRPRGDLLAWRDGFFQSKAKPLIGPKAMAAVAAHRAAGDMAVLATATCSFVASPCAAHLGFEHLVGTVPETDSEGRFTGRHLGTPSFREGKALRLDQSVRDRGETRSDFSEVWFYSDSIHDRPLLELCTHPVAVDPDPQLLALARSRGWRVESFKA